jgi:hypothetical protein
MAGSDKEQQLLRSLTENIKKRGCAEYQHAISRESAEKYDNAENLSRVLPILLLL